MRRLGLNFVFKEQSGSNNRAALCKKQVGWRRQTFSSRWLIKHALGMCLEHPSHLEVLDYTVNQGWPTFFTQNVVFKQPSSSYLKEHEVNCRSLQ